MSAGDDLLQGFQLIPSSIWGITGDHGSGRPPMELPAVNGLFVHHTVTPVTERHQVPEEGAPTADGTTKEVTGA